MTTLAATARIRLPLIDSLARLFESAPASAEAEDLDPTRAERAFLLETMDHCPDAFRSEEDIQTMMCLYAGRF